MKRITPNMTVNFEQFGKAASLPGLILARDWIDEQIRILQNDIAEPREAAPPREIYHEHPKGQFIPGVRASMKGLRRGTEAYRAADAHNKEVARDARRDALGNHATEGKFRGARSAWAGMSREERSKEMMRRRRVAKENKKRQAKVEAGRRGGARVWDQMTNAERKAKIDLMTAARLAAKEARVNGAVN